MIDDGIFVKEVNELIFQETLHSIITSTQYEVLDIQYQPVYQVINNKMQTLYSALVTVKRR